MESNDELDLLIPNDHYFNLVLMADLIQNGKFPLFAIVKKNSTAMMKVSIKTHFPPPMKSPEYIEGFKQALSLFLDKASHYFNGKIFLGNTYGISSLDKFLFLLLIGGMGRKGFSYSRDLKKRKLPFFEKRKSLKSMWDRL